jgi:hypothetical protein
VPIVVLDVLQSIHEAEQASVFRLMGDAAPPVAPVPPRVQEVLRGLYEANVRHVHELAAEIRRLGESPRARRPAELTSDESYLRFLSLQFLVPKLVREKQLMVERYENALRALPKELPAGIPDMLRRQLAEQVANVDALQAAVEKVA